MIKAANKFYMEFKKRDQRKNERGKKKWELETWKKLYFRKIQNRWTGCVRIFRMPKWNVLRSFQRRCRMRKTEMCWQRRLWFLTTVRIRILQMPEVLGFHFRCRTATRTVWPAVTTGAMHMFSVGRIPVILWRSAWVVRLRIWEWCSQKAVFLLTVLSAIWNCRAMTEAASGCIRLHRSLRRETRWRWSGKYFRIRDAKISGRN